MFGVIDIGSNTIRLSLYKNVDNIVEPMMNKKRVAGLASYVDDNNIMTQKGIEKAVSVLNEYNKVIEAVGVKKVFVFATASLRNIDNTKEVLKTIEEQTGMNVNVLSGEEEGYYDFVGATQKTNIDEGIIMDIGGGSTELTFVRDKKIEKVVSIPMGSLNTYRKYVKNLIPTKNEEKKIKQSIVNELEKITLPDMEFKYTEAYGIGGSIRGAFKLNRDFFELDNNEQRLERKSIKRLINIFEDKPHIAVSEILEVVPDRIHTVLTGMIMLKTIMKFYGCKTVELCKWGVREGYLIDNIKKEKNYIKEDANKQKVKSDIVEKETELERKDTNSDIAQKNINELKNSEKNKKIEKNSTKELGDNVKNQESNSEVLKDNIKIVKDNGKK